jgi:glycosyltransferase involved in cell wall biosynthesis
MKVLHVSTPRSWRGGEQQAAYLALALSKKGIDQTLLTPVNSDLSERLNTSGIPLEGFHSRGPLGLGLAKKIALLCKKEKFDLVHTHDSHAHSAAVLSAAVFGNHTPLVISRRVDFAISPSPFSRWKYNHPSVKRIICVSDMIRRITEKDIRNKEVLRVVHSGIDLSRYLVATDQRLLHRELSLPAETRIIGNLSALADHKDYPTFLRTVSEIKRHRKDVVFVIAGEGPEEKNIREMIREMGLFDVVYMLGFRKDVPQVMKCLDVFLITSSTEGLGTIVLEAFAAGVPVVATEAGGIPELVKEGSTGLTAPVGDAAELARQVLRVLADQDLRARLIAGGTNAVASFTFEQTAAKTLAIYREVLEH